ncbi:cell division protein SepF [Aestuariimicrobium ganziense]|uniref:cell division protein SepF n=1 Tax=Aestuariimicrobium ganziense TaxID=2773677 RepID=UPI001944F244|nr:cell division protein SepF [Aestuariimicrobium ganziense]
MADTFKRAAQWLGLVQDDRYDDYRSEDELTEQVAIDTDEWDEAEPSTEVAPINARSTQTRGSQSREQAPIAAVARTTSRPAVKRIDDLSRIITVHPRTYNEARTIGEHFRDGVPVIMNLTDMEDTDAKRLVDFAAGLIFGLHGTIERVTSKVFLLSPENVNVTAEDKQRIASGGFFNQS